MKSNLPKFLGVLLPALGLLTTMGHAQGKAAP